MKSLGLDTKFGALRAVSGVLVKSLRLYKFSGVYEITG